VPPEDEVEPVTAVQAADRLNRAASTIRCWVSRYNALQLRKVGKRMYYDYNDLYVIDREMYHGHPIPATWQERAEIRGRCPMKTAEPFPAAA
jgi:hypothetical protein